MTAMAGHDVVQYGVIGFLRQVEVHREVLPGEDVRILLTDVVKGVDEGLYMTAGERSIRVLTLGDVEVYAGKIAICGPGVDEDADIGLSPEQGIERGNVCLPAGFGGPSVDIDRSAQADGRGVQPAVITHAERRHEPHQFDRRQEVLPGYRTDQFLVACGVDCRPCGLSLGHFQQVDAVSFRDDENGTGLVPAVTVGFDADGQFDRNVSAVVGQGDLPEQDAAIGQVDDAVGIRIRERSE